jgi:hypothetical protein
MHRRADVVLGGGVLAARDARLLGGIAARMGQRAPHAVLRVVDEPPVIGAALLGLDALGAARPAEESLRLQLLARTAGSAGVRT